MRLRIFLRIKRRGYWFKEFIVLVEKVGNKFIVIM